MTFLGLVSMFHLGCLAGERHITIAKPSYGKILHHQPRNAALISGVCWFTPFPGEFPQSSAMRAIF